MRKALAVLAILCCCSTTSALAQVSFAFESPGVSIGFNVPVYPDLVRIPDYPVYYAPQLPANYFFYDGLYWVFTNGDWYASPWYNGPWQLVSYNAVPLFLLRVPVRYYRAPPAFFHGWAVNAPPRWDVHWGSGWEERHRGWDRWNKSAVPAPAPLPTYQRNYTGNRYPRGVDEQRTLESRNYRYQPRDRFAQQHVQQGAPTQSAQARPSTPTNEARSDRPSGEAPQRAQAPRPEQRAAAPAPTQRAQAPRPEQRAATPQPTQRAQAPRPEQRAATPQPTQRAQAPRPEQRAATPQPTQRAQAPRPEQRTAQPMARGPERPPQAQARGPEHPPQAQARAPEARGAQHGEQAQRGGGNENARAGERRNEPNG